MSIPVLCLPPALSSRRQPARCLGQTAEGPYTARTGYGALPTALAGSSSHSPEPTAGQKMVHVSKFLSPFSFKVFSRMTDLTIIMLTTV